MHKNKRILLIKSLFVVVIFASIVGCISHLSKLTSTESYTKMSSDLNECYSKSDFEHCQSRVIESYGNNHDLSALIAAVRFARLSHLVIENNCHQVMHEVGTEVFKKVEDISKALDICPDDCAYGCHHFAIASFLKVDGADSHASPKTIRDKVSVLCDKYIGQQQANCRHGLGHAAMIIMGYDLDQGLELCDLPQRSKAARLDCYQGVYMESMSLRNKKFVFDQKNPNEYCNSYDEDHQQACYPYLAYLWIKTYGLEKSIDMCNELPYISVKKGCVDGLGTIAYHTILPSEKAISECTKLAADARQWQCIGSLLAASINQHNSLGEALSMCRSIKDASKQSECRDIVSSIVKKRN